MTYIGEARKISSHLRRQTLFTELSISPGRFVWIMVYSDKAKTIIVGRVTVPKDGPIRVEGDPALDTFL